MLPLFYNYKNNEYLFLNYIIDITFIRIKWRHPSLSELTPKIFNTGLTHFMHLYEKTCFYRYNFSRHFKMSFDILLFDFYYRTL